MLLVVVLVLSLSPPPLAGFIGNTTRKTIKREGRRVTAFGCVSLREDERSYDVSPRLLALHVQYTVKKRLVIIPSPAGIIPGQGEFG